MNYIEDAKPSRFIIYKQFEILNNQDDLLNIKKPI